MRRLRLKVRSTNLKLPRSAIQQGLQRLQKAVERELPHGDVERREAELARVGTAPGCLDVDHAMGDVFVAIAVVRQAYAIEDRQKGLDHLAIGAMAVQNFTAQGGEGQIGLSRDDIVGQANDLLLVEFVTDLGTADHDGDLRLRAFEFGNQACRRVDVPDIDADPHDVRIALENRFDGGGGRGVGDEFDELGPLGQFLHIGQQITQAECGMCVAGIERREDDIGHRAAYRDTRAQSGELNAEG